MIIEKVLTRPGSPRHDDTELMATFLIKRLKPSQQEKFKWSPHTGGANTIKPNDYLDDGHVDANSPYDAWVQLRETERFLRVGDVVESGEGELHLCRYSGFEEVHWSEPNASNIEGVPAPGAEPAETGQPA